MGDKINPVYLCRYFRQDKNKKVCEFVDMDQNDPFVMCSSCTRFDDKDEVCDFRYPELTLRQAWLEPDNFKQFLHRHIKHIIVAFMIIFVAAYILTWEFFIWSN